MNKNELYHSDIYLGEDYTDGIKHWKYISKEKINGRWRYYYKDDKAIELKNKAVEANNKRMAYDLKTSLKDPKYAENQKKHIYYGDKTEGKRLSDESKKAYKAYKNYTISSFPRKVIATGAAFVLNLFSKFKK